MYHMQQAMLPTVPSKKYMLLLMLLLQSVSREFWQPLGRPVVTSVQFWVLNSVNQLPALHAR